MTNDVMTNYHGPHVSVAYFSKLRDTLREIPQSSVALIIIS